VLVLLGLSAFWGLKIALELNYGGLLLTNSAEILNILLTIFGVVLFEVSYFMKASYIEKASLESYYYDSNKYLNLHTYAFLDYLACLSICSTIIFYPFRIFMLLARFSQSKPILTLLNAVYRTLPGVMLYLVMAFFVAMGWTIAVHFIFGA
jgi:hypothetical protein